MLNYIDRRLNSVTRQRERACILNSISVDEEWHFSFVLRIV